MYIDIRTYTNYIYIVKIPTMSRWLADAHPQSNMRVEDLLEAGSETQPLDGIM
jgi:hypothetical protein